MDYSGRNEAERRRAERRPSELSAIARVPASPHRARIIDFSDSGCRIRFANPFAVPIGATVHIDFGPGRRVSGQVMWSGSEVAGIRFAAPLSPRLAALLSGEEAALEVEKPAESEYEPDPARFILHHWFRKLFRKAA